MICSVYSYIIHYDDATHLVLEHPLDRFTVRLHVLVVDGYDDVTDVEEPLSVYHSSRQYPVYYHLVAVFLQGDPQRLA